MTRTQAQRNIKLAEMLESGTIKQGHNFLRSEDKMCCLGVACEVFQRATKKGKWMMRSTGSIWRFSVGTSSPYDVPPEAVVKYFGWPDADPNIIVAKEDSTAIDQNDGRHQTFKQIAKGFRRLAEEVLGKEKQK
jgi:hypothetical protein